MRRPERFFRTVTLAAAVALLTGGIAGCRPSMAEIQAVAYAPAPGRDWPVSTPEAEELDPLRVGALYYRAARTRTTRSVLVVRHGRLIAERYFHDGAIDEKQRMQSTTKSVTSALVGIAIEKGCLESVGQKMMDFFPELAGRIQDPRKKRITIEQLLEMRAGYPWEESSKELFAMLYHGFLPSYLVDVPLVRDPGSDFDYSNLSSHLVGVIVARACSTDLRTMARTALFDPMGVEMGEWIRDWDGYYNGHADLHLTPRDMAKFGLLYLNDGAWKGRQLVPADWVERSLRTVSSDAWHYPIGKHFTRIGYGYQWWSATAGVHRFHFAWGHGGQVIALLEPYDMVVVVTADPLWGQHGGGPWGREKENLNLVGDFFASLPAADAGAESAAQGAPPVAE